MTNTNGFADMAEHFGTLSRVDPKKISMQSLENAANFYVKQLIPVIPKSLRSKDHMKDMVKIVIEDEEVKVMFDDTSYYWRFAENGTVNQKAQHFASGTYERNKNKIEELMTEKIIKLWEGE